MQKPQLVSPTPNSTEFHVPEGVYIYSRTDTRGVIIEANEAFAEISGYSREELIGQPHRMVRHPDMPSAVFADMWANLKAGRPWRGLVKNLRKDGGYYWVVANVAPVREGGRVVGYQSVRSRPAAVEIRKVEQAYAKINRGEGALIVRRGRVISTRMRALRALFELNAQLLLAVLVGAGLSVALMLAGLGVVPPAVLYTAGAIGLGWALIFGFAFMRPFCRDMAVLLEDVRELVKTGDLRKEVVVQREDELGVLAEELGLLVATTRAMVQGMEDTARQVSAEATALATQAKKVTSISAEQSERAAVVSISAEEVQQTRVSARRLAAAAERTLKAVGQFSV